MLRAIGAEPFGRRLDRAAQRAGADREHVLEWRRDGVPMSGSFQLRTEQWEDEFGQHYERYVFRTDDWLPDAEPTGDLGQGDRVLAQWFDGFWYPGIILTIQGKRVHLLFDDNDQAHLTWDKIRALDLKVGDRVFSRWPLLL